MLDLLGSGYVVDCCIAAVNRQREAQNWQIYMSDAAYVLIKCWAKNFEMPRYYDVIHPRQEDTRSGKEIVDEIIRKHGLKEVK